MNGFVFIAALALTGCAVAPPNGADDQYHYRARPTAFKVEAEHVSHLTAGIPFNPEREDGLSHVLALAEWKANGAYFQAGFGYNLAGRDGGGFMGPALTTTLRAGYEWRVK